MRLRLILSRCFPTLVIACLGAAAFAVSTPSTALAQNATTTPRAIISPTSIEVTEGGSQRYTVVLEEEVAKWGDAEWGTAEAVTVEVTRTGSSDVTVGDRTADTLMLIFTRSNWNTPQAVVVYAGPDDDIRHEVATLMHRITSGYDMIRDARVDVQVRDNTELPEITLTPEPGEEMDPIIVGDDLTVVLDPESDVRMASVEFSDRDDLRELMGLISVKIIRVTTAPQEPLTYGLGDEPTARLVVDVTATGPRPTKGFNLCLPVPDTLRTEAAGQTIHLLRYDSNSTKWEPVPDSIDDGTQVCADVPGFSLFAVGYDRQRVERRDLKMVLAGVGRTIASDAVEVLSGRFGASAGSQPKVTVGGQMLRLTGGKEGETVKQVTNVAVRVARMFGVTGGANGRTPEGTGDAAALSRHPGLFDGGTDRTNWRAPVRMRNVSVKDVLARSAFELPLSRTEDGGATGLVLWGRGMASNFSGSPDTGFSMDGDLYGGYVGLDYRLDPKVMLGLAVSHTNGEVDYEVTRPSNRAKVGLDLQLTSVLPYARWQPYDGLGVWGMFGAGWGEMDLDVAGLDSNQTTDLTLVMGALGGRHALISWNGIDFAAKADAFRSTLRSQGKGDGLPSARGNAGRMRLLVEGRTEYMISPESRLQPRLEVGGRWDTGDAEKGMGAEVGGGVAYTHTELGLAVEAQGRYLLAHQEEAFEDWGASLKVRMDPGIRGQGFWLSMAPVWGRPSTGAERLWGSASGAPMVLDSSRDRSRRSGWAPGQLEMDFGYGMAMSHDGLVTPYGGLAFGRSGAARYRFGSLLKLNTVLGLRVEGEREEQAGGLVSHGVMTRLDWQW